MQKVWIYLNSINVWLTKIQVHLMEKQLFADILQNRYPWKFGKINSKKHLGWNYFLTQLQV